MRVGDAHAGERASLLYARADEDVEAHAPLARGERASSRPSRAQCAAAAVVAILGASAVTGASRGHLPGLGSRNAVRRVADARDGSDAAVATVSSRAPSASSASRASASLGAVPGLGWDETNAPSDDARLADALRRRAAETGFSLEVSQEERERYGDWIDDVVGETSSARDANEGVSSSSRDEETRSSKRMKDLFFENVVANGADALPDVAPGVPFDALDDAYVSADGWAHAPARLTSTESSYDTSSSANDATEDSSSHLLLKKRKNSFSVCLDRARDWDVAFPEGWFQAFADGTLGPGYCVDEVILDEGGNEGDTTWACENADVVLFNEGAFIWQGAHRFTDPATSRETYVVPKKKSPEQVYVYFAHESPALFGSELLDRNLMDQFDYLASPNARGASAWWSFAPSARHLAQDFTAFARPFAARSPALAWLALDCGHEREGILGEISKFYPVWSLGACQNNKAASEDLPGRDSRTDRQRRRMQLFLSSHLFYFAGENSACPGYTTEKMWMALTRGSIPVYYGDGEYKKHVPCYDEASETAPCVLDVRDFPSAAALAERMREIANDEAEYNRLVAWRFKDPKTWPSSFRRAVAAASADVTRVTCGLLRGDSSGNKVKPALAQVAPTGGWRGVTATAEAEKGSFYAAAYDVADVAVPGSEAYGQSVSVNPDIAAALEAASEVFRKGEPIDEALIAKLRSAHCGTKDASPVFGRAVDAYARSKEPFADPESHYDRLCEDDARAACFKLKEPPL